MFKNPLSYAQYAQIALTVVFMAIIVASAVYVSAELRRNEPRATIIIVADIDCEAFTTQAQAQALLDAIPADPFHLDADRDGIACEALP